MTTVEGTHARDDGDVSYDGFISYSHAADDLLAPRLQSALQRFAKPWWKRRAVRIFRDESSLSANPHLWSSITEALDTSGWFVLLLSPDAARSEWVNQEIAYWVEHRDSRKILPVVTDGEFAWSDGDVAGEAVPDALRGVFSEEPRWVDVRWAKDEDQLDLQDPRFADAVADIASTIRGIPKDDLASEEVRQHRRTVRTAWAAGGLVTVLAISAIGFGAQSARNADEAERQAEIAAEQAEIAETNAEEARANAAEAEANAEAEAAARAEANRNEGLARSRELSAAAITVLEDDPELATRLVVHGASLVDDDRLPVPVVQALWDAGISNKLVEVADLGETLYTSMALSRDGSLLVAALANESLAFPEARATGRLVVFDALTMEPVWEWVPDELEAVLMPDISYDGRFVAVSIAAPPDSDDPESRLEIFELATGVPVTTLRYQDCKWMGAPAWSPDGGVLAIATAESPCARPESSTGRWVELLDTSTWETISVDELPGTDFGSHPEWSDEGELYVFGSHPVHRYGPDLGDPEVLETIGGFGDISPDGSLIAVFDFGYVGSPQFAIFDAVTLEVRDLLPWDGFPRFPVGAGFTEDGGSLFVAQEGAKTVFFDVNTGFSELVLPTGETDGVARDEATGRIYTSHNDGTVKVWNASGSAYGVEQVGDLGDAPWVNGGNSFSPGDGITGFDHWNIVAGEHFVSFFDQSTGEFVLDPIPAYTSAGALDDGRFVVGPDPNHLVVIDPRTGESETIYEADRPTWFNVSADRSEILVLVEEEVDGVVIPRWWATIDASGNVVETPEELEVWPLGYPLIVNDDTVVFEDWENGGIYAVDRRSGEELWRDKPNFFASQLTEFGFEGLGKTQFALVDVRTGAVESVPVVTDRPRGFEVSPDRSLLAVGDVEKLRIIDLSTGDEVQSVPIPLVSDIHWIDDENIVIGNREGVWARLSLSPADLLAAARASLTEGFTEGECALYAIDPCPTLAELSGQ